MFIWRKNVKKFHRYGRLSPNFKNLAKIETLSCRKINYLILICNYMQGRNECIEHESAQGRAVGALSLDK